MILVDPQHLATILVALLATLAAVGSAVVNVRGQAAVAQKAAESASLNTAYLAYRDLVVSLQNEVSRLKGEVSELRTEVERMRRLNDRLEHDLEVLKVDSGEPTISAGV